MPEITFAEPQVHERLTIFPVLGAPAVEPRYTLLTDALGDGTLRITEVGSGAVPGLLATNADDTAVLVLDGEQLIGAKQNRMTNRSLLLPAKSETRIPVSCMEQGRWRTASPEMAPSKQHSPAGVRRHARRAEVMYAAAGAAPAAEVLASAQSDTWAEIRRYSSRVGGRSATGALDHLYEVTGPRLDECARHFPLVPGQVGLLAFLGDVPLGMDVLGGRALYARVHPRLLRGYLLDALAATPVAGRPLSRIPGPPAGGPSRPWPADAAAARTFLDRVRRAERVPAPTVGQGTYHVLAGPVVGAELADDGLVVHLSAFPPADHRDATGGGPVRASDADPVAPPSRRRRKRG